MSAGHLLTNGRYRVLVTPSGAGYSALGEVLLTRWTADTTREPDGWFLYVRDLESDLPMPVKQLRIVFVLMLYFIAIRMVIALW